MKDSKEHILEEARELGYYVRRNSDMSRQDFVDWCNNIGTPWPIELHKLHTETINEDGVVDWSSNTRFKLNSFPWHADNPWHEQYRFPLRAFYAVNIPDDNDIINFLNITNWFENQSEKDKEYYRSLAVLTQDYKNGCQPYWSSLVKKHPVTGKESFFWGSMYIESNVYGMTPDEGHKFPHYSFTMAIQKSNREIVSPEEISSWFADMIDNGYMHEHCYKNGDFVLVDNWVCLHYRPRLKKTSTERLLWRRSILQPWQIYTG